MKSTKTVTALILTSAFLFQNFYAMKRSRSYPDTEPSTTEKSISCAGEVSTYDLHHRCEQIIAESGQYDSERTLQEVLNLCKTTFLQIKKTLDKTEATTDSFYINSLSSYLEIIKKINTIIFNIILKSDENTDIETITPPAIHSPCTKTKMELSDTFFCIASTIKKYKNAFDVPLTYKLPNYGIIDYMHQKMCNTWRGLWVTAQSEGFKN